MAHSKRRTAGLAYGPTAANNGRARPQAQRGQHPYSGPATPYTPGHATTPTGARTLPPAEFALGVTARSVRVKPRWAGSHWATGLGAPVRTKRIAATKAQPKPTAEVRKRGMYGY